jgi:hypothetical protein
MDPKYLFILCLVLFIVVGINAAIFATLRRKNEIGQIELIRRAVKRAQNPWEDEEEALKELAKRVGELKSDPVSAAEDHKTTHAR